MAQRAYLAFALPLIAACGGAATQPVVETPKAQASAAAVAQPDKNLNSVIAVIPVKDHAASTAWYKSWIGRDADAVPMPGVAEWKLTGGGWIQVALNPEQAGKTTVVVGVADAAAQRTACTHAGVTAGDLQDLGFIKMVEAVDPDGNKVVFVQETGAPASP